MTEDAKFSCTACHLTVEEGAENTMTACRLCGRMHCSDCVDEFGRCVACAEKAEGQDK
jgi:hypothetical protein